MSGGLYEEASRQSYGPTDILCDSTVGVEVRRVIDATSWDYLNSPQRLVHGWWYHSKKHVLYRGGVE